MKKAFRMATILIPVAVLLAGIGLWRNHYLKIMKAEPVKVYKVRPLQPSNPKVTSVKGDDNTDVTDIESNITTQRIDNSITPEEMDNTSNSPAGTIFGDITEQNLPPEAAAALKQYEEAQSEYVVIRGELISLLKASPLDMDAIELIDERKKRLKQQRKDALEILALYSDEAFNKLQATIAGEKAAESMMAELDGPLPAEESAAEKESAAKIERLNKEIAELYKDISTMTKEDLERGEELFDQLEKERSKSKK